MDSNMENCFEDVHIPQEIAEASKRVEDNLLPKKSVSRYEKTYEQFMEKCLRKNVEKNFSETVLLAYFGEKSEKVQSSTMWSIYSMIKSTLLLKQNVDISKYCKLIAFLKRNNEGHQAKKSKVLSRKNVFDFFKNASDDEFLLIKVS